MEVVEWVWALQEEGRKVGVGTVAGWAERKGELVVHSSLVKMVNWEAVTGLHE